MQYIMHLQLAKKLHVYSSCSLSVFIMIEYNYGLQMHAVIRITKIQKKQDNQAPPVGGPLQLCTCFLFSCSFRPERFQPTAGEVLDQRTTWWRLTLTIDIAQRPQILRNTPRHRRRGRQLLCAKVRLPLGRIGIFSCQVQNYIERMQGNFGILI